MIGMQKQGKYIATTTKSRRKQQAKENRTTKRGVMADTTKEKYKKT